MVGSISIAIRIAHHCVSNVVDLAHYDGACGRTRKRKEWKGGREEQRKEAGAGMEGREE